jgi:hypothetical protein
MTTYPRLYSDEQGESHFEDIEIDLTLTDYAPPAPPLSLSSFTLHYDETHIHSLCSPRRFMLKEAPQTHPALSGGN